MAVRVGVIGAGIMGSDHAALLARSVHGAELTAVADLDAARARALAMSLPPARPLADPFALIRHPDVDALVIASVDAAHAEQVLAAVAAGKPVLCEKPLAPTAADCRSIVDADRSAGNLVSVEFMRRFDPPYVELRTRLREGDLGTPLMLHCTSRGVSSGPGSTSETSETNSAIHELDVLPWLLDSPVVEVGWQVPRRSSLADGLQDPQLILIRTADGVLTTIETFLNARYGYHVGCEVVAERGVLTLPQPSPVVVDAAGLRSLAYAVDWRPRFAEAYRLELHAWVDALTAGEQSPLATAADGLAATLVAEAVIASMHAGGDWVRVDEAGPTA